MGLSVILSMAAAAPIKSLISIRGHPQTQSLPMSLTLKWPAYTCDIKSNKLIEVEIPDALNDAWVEGGWVNPNSYADLYQPSDLPFPTGQLSLGVVLTNGVPRYIFPSMVLSLKTPEKVWRNRGINTLPRAHTWIDVFSPYCPSLPTLKISTYGKKANDVRFLEDQDGATAWGNLLVEKKKTTTSLSMLRPEGNNHDIAYVLNELKRMLEDKSNFDLLSSKSFCFIDVIIPDASITIGDSNQIKQFLSDFDDTDRFLEIEEDDNFLENEALGEMSIKVSMVAPGGMSKFLPVSYQSLFDEGSILLD